MKLKLMAICPLLSAICISASAQGTAFTYQGRLDGGGSPVTGLYDFTNALYNASSGGAQAGSTITLTAVPVTNGLFTVILDFGAGVFNGTTHWLQIGVRTNGGAAFTGLSPRQELTPTPYAIFAEGANAAGLTGTIPAGDLTGVNGSGLTSVNAATLGGLGTNNFWQLTGNTLSAGNFLGSLNSQPVLFDVNGSLALTLALNGSLVMGGGSSSASHAVALGYNATASGGSYEVAIGNIPKATGNGSVAIGWNPTSSGPGSVAIGESVTSSGSDSFASGFSSQATANYSTAMGYSTTASGAYSMALGYQSLAQHTGSFVWSDDSSGTPYASSGVDQFLIRAQGGVGIGTVNAPQQFLSVHGGLNLDQANLNAGFINNGNTNGYALTFGSGSGEGIASERVAGANQYGLDFYTDFAQRMSLNNSGNLMLNGNDMYLLNGNANNGIGYRTSVAGVSPSGGLGIFVYGLDAGYLGTRDPDAVALWWDWHNNVTVNNQLTVNGEYLVVNGLTPVYAYIGDDGSGNDVQIGSQKSGITALAAYNTADHAYMHFYCSSITIEGGADLAEPFKITSGENEVPQGAVVVIDDQNPGHLKLSDLAYDTRVAGVVSGANGISPGIQMQQQGILDGGKNVALTGRVYVLANTSNGAIRPGDLLTTSSTPGHAMKVTDHGRAQGAILGKAMTGLSESKGMVLVLVTLQ